MACFLAGFVSFPSDALRLEQVEEALRYSIVIAFRTDQNFCAFRSRLRKNIVQNLC